jgi:type II secretory pathway pseudopilin PulG
VAAALLIGVVAFAWQATVARAQRDRAVNAENEATARADELKTVSDFQAGMLARINPPQAGDDLTGDVTAKFAEALADANPPVPEAERSALVESVASLKSAATALNPKPVFNTGMNAPQFS